MFFKSLKENLMYEFLISMFNGKRAFKRQLSLEQIVALNIYMNKGDRPLDYLPRLLVSHLLTALLVAKIFWASFPESSSCFRGVF